MVGLDVSSPLTHSCYCFRDYEYEQFNRNEFFFLFRPYTRFFNRLKTMRLKYISGMMMYYLRWQQSNAKWKAEIGRIYQFLVISLVIKKHFHFQSCLNSISG